MFINNNNNNDLLEELITKVYVFRVIEIFPDREKACLLYSIPYTQTHGVLVYYIIHHILTRPD